MYYVADWDWHIKSPHTASGCSCRCGGQPLAHGPDLPDLGRGLGFLMRAAGAAGLILAARAAPAAAAGLRHGGGRAVPALRRRAWPTGWSSRASGPSWRAIGGRPWPQGRLRRLGLRHHLEPPVVPAVPVGLHRRRWRCWRRCWRRAPGSACAQRFTGLRGWRAAGAAGAAAAGCTRSCCSRAFRPRATWSTTGICTRCTSPCSSTATGWASTQASGRELERLRRWSLALRGGLHRRLSRAAAHRRRRRSRRLRLARVLRNRLHLDGDCGDPGLGAPSPQPPLAAGCGGRTNRCTPGTCCTRP